MYSFGWTGVAMGLFPARKVYSRWADEWHRGVQRDRYVLPRRYMVIFCLTLSTMSLLGSILST
jgi:hypothetical protein